MEDEQSKLSVVGVSELPAVNVSDESVLGQMSSETENPVEDSYVVENGDEIMVEIVGSDVFLDGMRPTNEGNRDVPQDLEVKCSESDEVHEISTLGNETIDDNRVVPQDLEVKRSESTEVDEISTLGNETVDDNSMNERNLVVPQDLEVKCRESDEVHEILIRLDDVVDDNNANDPVEAAVVVREIGDTEVDSDVKGIKDEEIADKGASANIVTDDKLNESAEAIAEGETVIAMVVTEESTVKSEAAENNSSNEAAENNRSNDQSNDISQVQVADADKPSGNGEGIDMEHFEQQGNATIQELLVHAENVCPLAYDADNQIAENDPGADAEIGLENLVEENGSPQNKELEGSLQKGEMEHDDVDVSENVEVATLNDEINKSRESEEDSGKNHEHHPSETTPVDVEMETELYQNHHQEDSGKNHEHHPSETTPVDVEIETELYQNHQQEDSGKNHEHHPSGTTPVDVEIEMELYQNHHQEDTSKSHGSHSSEARLVEETEPNQEYYYQEEEVDAETEQLSDEVVPSLKRKALDPLTDCPDKKANFNAAHIASTDQIPKPSFKIGECIRRVASQLTGGTSMVVNEISSESSVIDMLFQFQILAQDPSKPCKFRDEILSFFSGFRNSVVATKRVRKKKGDISVGGPAEEFEFDDAKDSYWTDMIVQNNPEMQTLHDDENGEGRIQLAIPVNGEKLEKSGRKPQSRKKRYFTGHIPNTSDGFEDKAKRLKQETSPAELILNFAERKCVPSEINLNKMFRRFGSLMESETEVDYESGQARVIYKRGSDAEVAHSSSQKFSIFGPVLVSYQIGYSPLISVKVSPLQTT